MLVLAVGVAGFGICAAGRAVRQADRSDHALAGECRLLDIIDSER